ncbi:hypothetical protein ABID39_000226 [Bartonella japonica]|uniref:Uncharacterized protein n=1 Tax=Bartonella japonica TaxID=357761 RepID=A0ABV2FLV6_9HYPH
MNGFAKISGEIYGNDIVGMNAKVYDNAKIIR